MSDPFSDDPPQVVERRYPNRDLIRELARRHAEELLVSARQGADLKKIEQSQDDELIKILSDIPKDDRPAFERVYRQEAEIVVGQLAPEAERIAGERDNTMLGYLLLACAIFFALGFAWQYLF